MLDLPDQEAKDRTGIGEDVRLQRRTWMLQRVAWAGFAVLIVGTLTTGAASTVLRAGAVYLFLLFMLRAAGRRTLAESTTFDFALVLIISEALQQALVDSDDTSISTAFIAVVTLIGLDIALSLAKNRWPALDRLIDGTPLLLVENGRCLDARMRLARIARDDILSAARGAHAASIEDVQFAVLETDGRITIVRRGIPPDAPRTHSDRA